MEMFSTEQTEGVHKRLEQRINDVWYHFTDSVLDIGWNLEIDE